MIDVEILDTLKVTVLCIPNTTIVKSTFILLIPRWQIINYVTTKSQSDYETAQFTGFLERKSLMGHLAANRVFPKFKPA